MSLTKLWPLSLLGAALLVSGCLTPPPVHQRALDNNELCAQKINEGDLTRAEVYCDLGLQFSPTYADLWVNKGLIALRRNQNDQAKEYFIKALRYNQEQAQAYNNLGFIYYQEHEYGKAHDNFQRALKVNPDYTEARYNLAHAFIGLKETEKAKKELRTIIAINDGLADPHHSLCGILMEEKAYEEAEEECQKAVERAPDYDDAWNTLGNVRSEAGKFCEAKEAYTSCIEANTNNSECRNNAALIARKCALLDPVVKEAKENKENSDTPEGLFTIAKQMHEKGLLNDEERTYKKCLKKDAKYAPCHYGLYEIYRDARRDKEALIACKNVVKFATAEDFPKEVETCEKVVSSNTY
ncbi:MAG: tetratricopeptide repeat protein [Myxococcaceae bacterium]